MSESNNNSTGNGIGLGGVLFTVFLTLKLCGVISWSWWWVTAPLWGPLAIVGIVLLVSLIVLAILK